MCQGFDVRKTDIDELAAWIAVFTKNTMQAIEDLSSAGSVLGSISDFSGAAADASQAYWIEVHGPVLTALNSAIMELYTRYGEYVTALTNLDEARDAKFASSALERTSGEFGPYANEVTDKTKKIGDILSSIDDIISLTVPNETDLTERLFDLSDLPRAHRDSVDGIESIYERSAQDLDSIIDLVERAIAFTGSVGSFESYKASSVQNEVWFSQYADTYLASTSYTSSQIESSDTAYSFAIERINNRQAEAARRDEGWAKVIPGLFALGGGLAIILSGGAAAPLAVPMVLFASAELYEGGQDIWYAHNHDTTTAAWNPIRDTIFFGNQDAYNAASFGADLLAGAGSFVGPIGSAYSMWKGGEGLAKITTKVGGSLLKSKVKGDIKNAGVDVAFTHLVDPLIEEHVEGPKTKEAVKKTGRDAVGKLIPDLGDKSKNKFAEDIPEGKETSKLRFPLINGPYIKDGKPNGRPKLSGKKLLDFERAVYKKQVDKNGILRDPNTGEIIDWKPGQPRQGVCDFGHKTNAKYSEFFEKYANGEISLEELKEHEFNPENFRIEAPSANRSHKYE